jgi:hypothetical protein
MKKAILAVILIISAVFCVFGQNSGPIDIVLLLDTSSAMGSSYERVNDYITGAFLSEFLRTGDTFHLITFSSNPRLDIARRISARGDVETIIGRMLIQYPVETGNDVRAAVNYVEAYISTLPPRPKKIVMVSAGGSDTNNIVSTAKQRLGSKNATLDFVSVTGSQPIVNPPSSGRPSPAGQTASQQRPSSGTASGTASTGTTASTPPSAGGAASSTSPQGASQTSGQSSTQPSTSSPGSSAVTAPNAADNTTSSAQGVSPSGGDKKAASEQKDFSVRDDKAASKTQKKSGGSFNPTLLLIIGIIIALLLLILLIIFVSRRLGSSPNRVMASVSALGREKEDRFADHSNDLARYAASQSKRRVTPYSDRPVNNQVGKQPTINPAGPLLLNLFVEDQNTSIGKRNIHSLKSGYSLSVGGSKADDFLIFLVPVPSHLGEVRRNGSQLTFVPRKPKYFPDIGSNEVKDCINKKIRIVSDKNYEMWFSFVMYEDPLIALNRVLHSIKVPG